MIALSHVKKTFYPNTPLENYVLRDLSLSIDDGEFVVVIGSNGAGKSTLLNVLSGEVSLDSGNIMMGGRDVSRFNTAQRSQVVARVFQDPLAGTCADLSIEENLSLAIKRGETRHLTTAVKKSYLTKFQQSLAELGLGLENRLTDKMGLLSGGQRQAVSLLMATLQPSSVLLLDEHTAALDPKTARFVLQLTNNIVQQKHLTTLMVTHSMQQALEIGTRTIMLHQGRVVFDISGADRDNLKIPDLLALFERQQGELVSDDALLLG